MDIETKMLNGAAISSIPMFSRQSADGLRLVKELARMAAHSSFQGGMSMFQGGKFIHGFAAGAMGSVSGAYTQGSSVDLQLIVAAGVGGTAAAIGGGKFANGAITGAFVGLFNHARHQGQNKIGGENEKVDPNFYYNAVDGMEFPDGTVMSKDDFVFSFTDDPTANARYGGFVEGKHHVNFAMSDYEVTVDNIRALVVHEAYGHGVMGFSQYTQHHRAYFSSIDSKYWENTTVRFKQHTVNHMWTRYAKEVGVQRMPQPYQRNFDKFQTMYD